MWIYKNSSTPIYNVSKKVYLKEKSVKRGKKIELLDFGSPFFKMLPWNGTTGDWWTLLSFNFLEGVQYRFLVSDSATELSESESTWTFDVKPLVFNLFLPSDWTASSLMERPSHVRATWYTSFKWATLLEYFNSSTLQYWI